jgi:hypothetical protein
MFVTGKVQYELGYAIEMILYTLSIVGSAGLVGK